MAIKLRISDGTTTVNLDGTTTGIAGCTYVPLAPSAAQETVAEQAEIVCSGAPFATIRAALGSIERLLQDAQRRRETGYGARVFLEYKPVAGDASYYRSELYGGRLVLSEEPGARRFDDTAPQLQAGLVFERAPWWEGPETEVQLSAQGLSAATGGRQIVNNGNWNWVQVAAAQVPGTLPAPVRIVLTNDTGADQDYRTFYIGVNAFSNPSTFGGVHQGEDDVENTTHQGAVGTASGGAYTNYALTTSEAHKVSWLLSAAQMGAGGRWFRLLARVHNYTPAHDVRVRPVVREYNGLTVLWQGDAVLLPNGVNRAELVDLGSVPVPPGAWDTSYQQVRLCLSARAATASTLSVDYVQLVPLDAFRRVVQLGMVIPNGSGVEVDEIEGRVGAYNGLTRAPLHVATGPGLRLWPNRLQQIRILNAEANEVSDVADTLSVRVYIRPRRATV